MIVEGEVRARDGQALPDSGTVVITWVVSAGPEDYVFVYGMGTQRGAEFVVQLDAPPPAEALNNATLGVGVVLLVPEDSAVSEGRIEGREFEEGALEVVGVAGRYAVIYRAGEEPGLAWADEFPLGFSCGRGVDAVTSQDFDTFEPVDCSTLVLDIGDLESADFVNWT